MICKLLRRIFNRHQENQKHELDDDQAIIHGMLKYQDMPSTEELMAQHREEAEQQREARRILKNRGDKIDDPDVTWALQVIESSHKNQSNDNGSSGLDTGSSSGSDHSGGPC